MKITWSEFNSSNDGHNHINEPSAAEIDQVIESFSVGKVSIFSSQVSLITPAVRLLTGTVHDTPSWLKRKAETLAFVDSIISSPSPSTEESSK